ncbi:DUF3008 family protein [Paracoccus sp. PAR01]|nr:DUF3008 family protein [Paracoccus sp. PAR01]
MRDEKGAVHGVTNYGKDDPGTSPLSLSGDTDRCRHHLEEGIKTPAKSKAGQKAAGAALLPKPSETPKGNLRSAAKAMTEAQLEEMASTKRKGKPEHVKK